MRKTSRLLGGAFAAALLSVTVAACTSTETRESTGQYVDSSVISNKVRAQIVKDPNLSLFDIDVTTYKDVVQLSGFVDSQAQKERAAQLAANVEGVKKVENNITVKPRSSTTR